MFGLTALSRFCFVLVLCAMSWGGAFAEMSGWEEEEVVKETAPQIFTLPKTPTHANRPCLVCNEEGMTQSELDYSLSRKKSSNKHKQMHKPKTLMKKCQICQGKKTVYRKLYLDERLEFYLKQRAEFDKAHLTAYRKRVGSAYADAAYLDALDPIEFAKLAAQYPDVCKKCKGFTMTLCSTCDGSGRIAKKEKDATGETIYKRVICSLCNGDGGRPCKTCDSSGLLPLCKRCNGRGVMEQRARRDAPASIERCKSCLGMGRR